jgi:hypothetical protein
VGTLPVQASPVCLRDLRDGRKGTHAGRGTPSRDPSSACVYSRVC